MIFYLPLIFVADCPHAAIHHQAAILVTRFGCCLTGQSFGFLSITALPINMQINIREYVLAVYLGGL